MQLITLLLELINVIIMVNYEFLNLFYISKFHILIIHKTTFKMLCIQQLMSYINKMLKIILLILLF